MKRQSRERLIAVALTIVLLLLLLSLAGVYQVRRAEPELLALTFSRGHAVPQINASVPRSGPRRMELDAARMPRSTGASASLQQRASLSAPAQLALATHGAQLPQRSQSTLRSSRPLVPRTRAAARTSIGLAPFTDMPQPKLRRALPPAGIQQRATAREVPVALEEVSDRQETLNTTAIMEWMKLQPSTLPPGIRQHIEYREGSLTSVALLNRDGVAYELFLMARIALQELHVVLVTGEASYYLIDRSFLREGRKFRVGTVRRNDTVITGVISEERAAGSPEADHFYRVFLSWWDGERLRLQ